MRGKESMYSVPPKEENSSQQTPYFKEIVDPIIRMTGEVQEGFNKQIKRQQTK